MRWHKFHHRNLQRAFFFRFCDRDLNEALDEVCVDSKGCSELDVPDEGCDIIFYLKVGRQWSLILYYRHNSFGFFFQSMHQFR